MAVPHYHSCSDAGVRDRFPPVNPARGAKQDADDHVVVELTHVVTLAPAIWIRQGLKGFC